MIATKEALQYYTVVYFYTTTLNKEKNRVKVGSARRLATSAHAAALQRIKEQVTAANSADPFEILHVEDVSEFCETGIKGESLSNLRKLEQTWLHPEMKKQGMWVFSKNSASEWFFSESCDQVVTIGRKLINEYCYGSTHLNTFAPHKFQQEAIDKAVNYFLKNGTDFLLDCVMRFGKCFTSYKICKELGHKRILVITGRPKVKNGWRDDLDHVDFTGWNFIDSQTVKDPKFYESNALFEQEEPVAEVIFASFQGGKKQESRIEKVLEQQIDCVIIDEAHAYLSEDALEFIKNLDAKNKLWVSGTPFKAYKSGMFDGITNTYRFTLLDLLREKKRVQSKIDAGETCDFNELRYLDFPDVQFIIAEYAPAEKDELYDEQSLNMKALLSNNNGVPNYPDEVQGLLNSLLDDKRRSPFTYGGREVKYPVNPQHIWMAVPAGRDDSGTISVAAASTMVTSLNQHPLFGAKYAPIAIKGDKDQDDVQRHIDFAKHQGLGSVAISCRSLNTGTKFPDMDTVVWLNETSSAAEFWQTNGRPMQPKPDKESINIICFSIEMVVSMAHEMVMYSDKDGENYNELMHEFLTMMPIYVQAGPRIHLLDINEVFNKLTLSGDVKQSFGGPEGFDNDLIAKACLEDPDFILSIPDVENDDEPNVVQLFSSGEKGKNSKVNYQQLTKQEKDFIKVQAAKIREFGKQVTSVMAASLLYDGKLITSVSDLREVNAKTIDDLLYPGTTDIIVKLLDKGIMRSNVFDHKISAYYNVELKDLIDD